MVKELCCFIQQKKLGMVRILRKIPNIKLKIQKFGKKKMLKYLTICTKNIRDLLDLRTSKKFQEQKYYNK